MFGCRPFGQSLSLGWLGSCCLLVPRHDSALFQSIRVNAWRATATAIVLRSNQDFQDAAPPRMLHRLHCIVQCVLPINHMVYADTPPL